MSLTDLFEDVTSDDDVGELERIRARVVNDEATADDYEVVRRLAKQYLPNRILKVSPRLVSRDVSVENIEFLKQTAGKAAAVGIVVLISVLIAKILGLGEADGDAKGGGGGKKAKELEAHLDQMFSARFDELRELTQQASTQAPLDLPAIIPHVVDETTKPSHSKYTGAETLSDADQALFTQYADSVKLIESKFGKLKVADLRHLLKEYLAVSEDIKALIRQDVQYSDEKVTADRVKHMLNDLSAGETGIMQIMQRQRAHKLLRGPMLNDKVKYDEAVRIKSDFIHTASGKLVALANTYLNFVDEFARASDANIEDIAQRRNIPSGSKSNPSQKLEEYLVEFLGQARDHKYLLERKLLEVRQSFGLDQDDSELVKQLDPKVLVSILKSGRLTDELREYDTLDQNLVELDKVVKELDQSLQWLDEEIGKLEDSSPRKGRYQTLYADLHKLCVIIRGMLTAVGFTKAGDLRIADQLMAVDKALVKMHQRYTGLNQAIRTALENGAVSNESYASATPPTSDLLGDLGQVWQDRMQTPQRNLTSPLARFSGADTDLTQEPEQRTLPMREIRIPKGVILPDGVDINGLRELVEDDPSDWTQEELFDYVDQATVSLESLHNDIGLLSPVVRRIQRTGMICQADVFIVEKLKPGLITKKTPIGRFSSFESVNYAQPSLEDAQRLEQGARAVVAIAGIAIIAKIIQWCYKRFQMSRDTTTAIKGRSEVIAKLNDQAIAMFSGLNGRVSGMAADKQGQLKDAVGKWLIEKGYAKDWFNFDDYEKSMYELRKVIFAKNHAPREGGNKGFSKLVGSVIEGGEGFKLLQQIDESCNKGGSVLDKAVDTVENLIHNAGNATEAAFKGVDYGFNNFSMQGLRLGDAKDNTGRVQLLTNYVQDQSAQLYSKDELKNYPVDKINSNLGALSGKLQGIDGKLDKSFEKITKRLDKLEAANNQQSEKDKDGETDKADSRVAIKGYIDALRTEFQTYSALLGAQTTLLGLVQTEVQAYQGTLKQWSEAIKQITSLQAKVAKVTT